MRAFLRKVGSFVASRSRLITVAAVSVIAGIVLSAGFTTAVEYANTPNFCAHSCHEMERTVHREYTNSKHFKNTSGTVVTCTQCHAPQGNWRATIANELSGAPRLWAHVVDRAYLPGRFEARRAELAKKVLADFKANNARECKACHVYANMVLSAQSQTARNDHTTAMKSDANCMDCHQGVAHQRTDVPASYDFP